MQHNIPVQVIGDVNHRLTAERAVGAHRPAYLDQYSRLNYNNIFRELRTVARDFNDQALERSVEYIQELRERAQGNLDALRVIASVAGHNPIPSFFIGIEHFYDWALQGYNNAFPQYEPVYLYQKRILQSKNKTVSSYVLNKYPSYPHTEIEKSGTRNQQDANPRPAMGDEVHGAAHILGIGLRICPEIEASIIRIRGLENIVNEVNQRTVYQDWDDWRRNSLVPWLDDIPRQQGRLAANQAQPAPHIPDNAPSLEAQARDFLAAWDLKNPIGGFRERQHRLVNSTWARQRAEFNEANPYDPFYLLEAMRLLAYIVAYARSPHFRSLPQEAQNLFYQQFFYSLTQSLANCHRGVFDRMMMFVRDTMLSMHREYVDQNFNGAQDIVDDMISFLLKTDASDISQQTLVPSSVLKSLVMRTMRLCQNLENASTINPWDAIFLQQNSLQHPESFARARTQLEAEIAQRFGRLSLCRSSVKNIKVLHPDIFLSAQELEMLAQLPLAYHEFFDHPQLAQQNAQVIFRQIQQLPDYNRVITPEGRAQLLTIIRKKIRLAQVRGILRPELEAQHPDRALAESVGLQDKLTNLLADQVSATKQNAIELFAQISQCASILRDTTLIRAGLQLRAPFLRQLDLLAANAITLDELRAADCVRRTLALVETISAPRPDRSFEPSLQAFLEGRPIDADTILGRIIQARYGLTADVVRESQLTYFEQDQLPDTERLPSVHDFLREASRLSGLSVPYLKLVLAILGRQTKDLLTRPEHDDPLEGEIRPLYRGLKILFENYCALVQAGPSAHSVLLSDSDFVKELLEYHSICAQNYHAAEAERKTQLAPYYGHINQRLAQFNSSLDTLIQQSGRHLADLLPLLGDGQVDLVETILLSLTSTHQDQLVDPNPTAALQRILAFMHMHQHYRLFSCLLKLTKVLNIKAAVFDADLLSKILCFSKAGELLPVLTTLQKEEALVTETAVILSRIDITASYIRALLCEWDDFSYLFDPERLQQMLPNEDMANIRMMIQGLEFHFLKHGFRIDASQIQGRDVNFIFIYRMIEYGINHQNPQTAVQLFNIFLAPVWQQVSGERILNERLASLILKLAYNEHIEEKKSFIRHIGQWCRHLNVFTANSRLDFSCVPSEYFQRAFSVEDIEYFAFVAQTLGINVIVLPNNLPYRYSISVIQKMEQYRYAEQGPRLQFFYSIYGKISFKDFLQIIFSYIKRAADFVVQQIQTLWPAFGRHLRRLAPEPVNLVVEEPAPADTRSMSQIYRAHRALRFSQVPAQDRQRGPEQQARRV